MPVHVRAFENNAAAWDAFVARNPGASFSHRYAWLQVIRQAYGGQPFYLAATTDADSAQVVGVLPLMRRRVLGFGPVIASVPYADQGGICAENADAARALLDRAAELAREVGAAWVELRHVEPIDPELPCDTSRVTLVRPLPEAAEELWKDLRDKSRNQVRKARRSGLEARDGGLELVGDFYDVYARNMRDLGSPMHSLAFFQLLLDHMGDHARVVVVQHEGKTIGGAIVVRHGATITAPWSSSLRPYFSMCPNNLLYWRIMELGIEWGCSQMDFGRSPRDSGTYRFKKNWGSEEVQLYYQFIPVKREPPLTERRESAQYRMFSRIWRHVPVGLAKAIGPRIMARLPL